MRPWDMDGLYGVGAKHSRAARITPCQLALLLIRQGMAYKPSPAGLAPTTMRSRDNGQWSVVSVGSLSLVGACPASDPSSQDCQPRYRQQGWLLQPDCLAGRPTTPSPAGLVLTKKKATRWRGFLGLASDVGQVRKPCLLGSAGIRSRCRSRCGRCRCIGLGGF